MVKKRNRDKDIVPDASNMENGEIGSDARCTISN